MDKIKFLAFMAATAMFFACGSQESGSPPELKNGANSGNPVLISPFDTLVVEFNSSIAKIRETILSPNIKQINPLRFVGEHDIAEGGFKHFKQNEKDSIVFLDVENNDGYIQRRAVFYYSTYPILDSPNNSNESPDDIEVILGRSNLTKDGVTFAGVIGVDLETEWADFNDYFKLSLKAFDTLEIKLSNTRSTDVKVELIAPFKEGNAVIPAISNSIVYEMDPRNFNVSDFQTLVQFKIRVFPDDMKLTPYLLTVKIKEWRKI